MPEDTPTGWFIESIEGTGIINSGPVSRWYPTDAQAEAIYAAAKAADLDLSSFIAQFDNISELLMAVFGEK